MLQDYPLTTGTQRQPEEQAELYQRPSASSSFVPPVALSHLDPSVSRPMQVAPAPPVRQPAPGYSDPHVSPPAGVPDQSLPHRYLPLDPSVSRPLVGATLPVRQPAPGYSDRHVSPPAAVLDQSFPYPYPSLDPSVSRPMVAAAHPVRQPAPGYSDPHVSRPAASAAPAAPAAAPDRSFPYPYPSLDPSVSRPVVAAAHPVRQPAPGYSDPHVSPPAGVPDQSLPYPIPVSQSSRDNSLLPLPASGTPISTSPSHADQNNPSTDAVSETIPADSRQVSGPANTGGLSDQDITDHGTTSNTRTSVPVDSALGLQLTINGCFLDPEKYEPVKLLGSGGFAKVIYHLLIPFTFF